MSRLKAVLVLVLLFCAFSASAQDGQVHIVAPGESLFRISQQYGVDVDTIARANNITNTWLIHAGQKLIIPSTNDSASDLGTSADSVIPVQPTAQAPVVETPTALPTETHTIGFGENLAQIAQNYGMTLDQLASMNHITNPDLIYAGQKLVVTREAPDTSLPSDQPPTVSALPENVVTHVVQQGETLASIGQRYGVSWLQIAQANNIYDADHVEVGQELTIPGGSVIGDANYSFITAPAAPPARIGTGKEVIVDLSDSRAYAYEDGKLVRNVLVSTGLPGSPTVQGDFKVQRKYLAQTMTGPGYYLPDVPYVMYFYAGYALHGTYWHNNFGHPMSHGCVNLPTPEAAWFYDWTQVGTPVHVQP